MFLIGPSVQIKEECHELNIFLGNVNEADEMSIKQFRHSLEAKANSQK